MAAIARRAGVTPAAMYYHFTSREDLLVALVERVSPEVAHLFGPEDDPASEVGVEDVVDRFLGWVREEPAAARFYFVTAPGIAAPAVREAYAESQAQVDRRVEAWLERLAPTGDVVETWVRAMGLASLFQEIVFMGLEQHARPQRGFHAVERAGRQLANTLLAG